MAGNMRIEKINLGPVSAYAVAKAHGFTGTEAEWELYISTASTHAQQAAGSALSAAQSAAAAAAASGEISDQNEGLFLRYDDDASLTEASKAQFRKNAGISYTEDEALDVVGEALGKLGKLKVWADIPGFWSKVTGSLDTRFPNNTFHTRMIPVSGFSRIIGRTWMDENGWAVAYFDMNYNLLDDVSVSGAGTLANPTDASVIRFGRDGNGTPLTVPAGARYVSISGWGSATDYWFLFEPTPGSEPSRIDKLGVSYADFGAKLDGTTDDSAAVVACHNYANTHGCPVYQHSGTVYMETAVHPNNAQIKTDVDWTGTTFLIKPPIQNERIVFAVAPDEELDTVVLGPDNHPEYLDQLHDNWMNIPFMNDYQNEMLTLKIMEEYPDIVIGVRDGVAVYTEPSYYSETVTVDRNGGLMDGPLFLDMASRFPRDGGGNNIGHLKIVRRSTMDKPITIKGGTFLLASTQRFVNPYYLYISRSNVTVEGLQCDAGDRHVNGDSTYRAELIRADYAYNLCFRDCVFENFTNFFPRDNQTWNQTTYVLVCTHCSTILIDHCHFLRGWGPMQTSWCKRLTVRNSVMGRIDNHYGCRDYLIEGCTMVTSHSNINVGYGDGYLTVRDTKFIKTRDYDTIFNSRLVYCREDFCSIFQGVITLENIHVETFYETTLLYAAMESSHAFKYESSNKILPCKLPKVRIRNVYFRHHSDSPVKLTIAEYGVRAEASALTYGNVAPDDMIMDGFWSDQNARILPMLQNVNRTGSEPWMIKLKNYDCRIDVAEDDTIDPSENLDVDIPLVRLIPDPEMFVEQRIMEAAMGNIITVETEENRQAAQQSEAAAAGSASEAAASEAAAAASESATRALQVAAVSSRDAAADSATAAAGSATAAASSETNAAGSATAAASSETNAAGSATAAASSETNAASSAAAAAASAAAAEAALEQITTATVAETTAYLGIS